MGRLKNMALRGSSALALAVPAPKTRCQAEKILRGVLTMP
jgi:hypothetical protein